MVLSWEDVLDPRVNVIVTGSSGQIGSYVVDRLRASGHTAVGIDRRASSWTDIVHDLRVDLDISTLTPEPEPTSVIHCAAQVSVAASVEEPWTDAENNIAATINAARLANRVGASTFVNVSSAAVYGPQAKIPIRETALALPTSPYGVGKLAGEHYARVIGELAGMRVLTLRPFNVYSPRQDGSDPYSGVIAKFLRACLAGEPPVIFGDGLQTRDFIYAPDLARWLVDLATTLDASHGAVLNAGTGVGTTIEFLATVCARAVGVEFSNVYAAERTGEIRHSVADVSSARLLGLTADVRLESGIKELVMAARE